MTAVAAVTDPGVLATALDGLGDGVLVVRGREVLVANRAAHRMTGRADGTLVGGPAPAWVARAAARGGALDVPLAAAGGGRR